MWARRNLVSPSCTLPLRARLRANVGDIKRTKDPVWCCAGSMYCEVGMGMSWCTLSLRHPVTNEKVVRFHGTLWRDDRCPRSED